MHACKTCGGNKLEASCAYPQHCCAPVKSSFRKTMLPYTLAELGWTYLLGVITFSVLTLAICVAYYMIAFFWSIFT